MLKILLPLPAILFLTASVALAHPHHAHPGEDASFLAGLAHPWLGADHLLAMIAVGLWASLIGGRGLLAVPAAFVAVMSLGFVLARFDVPLPMVEPFILASVVVLGLVVAMALRLPVVAGMALVGFFALFHGHAHGAEMADGTALAFGAGFALSTAVLHGVGLAIGLAPGRLLDPARGVLVTRAAGALTVCAGILFILPG